MECLKESQSRVTIVTERVQQGSQLLQVDVVRRGPDRAVNFGENDRDTGIAECWQQQLYIDVEDRE